MNDQFKPATLAALQGVATDTAFGAVAPPLYFSSNYAWSSPDDKPTFDYARSGNPTRSELEQALDRLEGAAGGVVTASGMAALDLLLCLVEPGSIVIAPHDAYGGTHRLYAARAKQMNLDIRFIDQTDRTVFDRALNDRPALVLIETPSNPLLRLVDIRAYSQAAKSVGALVAVDNTFMSPARQRPLELGADLVVHSTTKFINGHSDVVGGAALAADPALAEQLAWWANCTGTTGAPFDAYQTLRGLRSMHARVAVQDRNAEYIAHWLESDSRIAHVYFPGLEHHPGYGIACLQQAGFGSILSLELAEGVDPNAFVKRLKLFTLAESLGGFESLSCVPAKMTHAAMPPEARNDAGISDSLIRLSIGLEAVDDLIADLENALQIAAASAVCQPVNG